MTVYIDEAGDPGVRDGLRYFDMRYEWLALGAVVLRAHREPQAVDWVRAMLLAANSRQRGELHYARITRDRRSNVCAALAVQPVRAFCLLSHKTNMRLYENPRLGRMTDPGKFYNWCTRILLERVMRWCAARQNADGLSPGPIRIVFSERGGHDYEHMFNYFDKLSMQARTRTLHIEGRSWLPDLADRQWWEVVPHHKDAGLQLADCVASAFYQAANHVSPAHDIAPAVALSRIMAKRKGLAQNYGVTLWPLEHQARTPSACRPIFEHYGYRFG